MEFRLGRRLMRDRRIKLARVSRDAALDQPAVGAVCVRRVHRPVEILTVVAVGIDVMEEVGGRDRRMAAIQRDDNSPEAGFDLDRDEVVR